MSYSFNRSGYVATQGSANSLPAGDWTFGGWTLIDSIGTAAPVILGQAASDGGWYSLGYYENLYTDGVLRLHLAVRIQDDAGWSSGFVSSGWYAGYPVWQHLLVQRSANVLHLYVDGKADAADASVEGGVTITAANMFGRGASVRLAEWAQWNRALDVDEIAALAKGYSPLFFPRQRKWYLPMVRELQEFDGAVSVEWTDVGIDSHPSILRPSIAGDGLALLASSGETSEAAGLPPGWTPPYRTVAGSVWHSGAVAGHTCS